MLLYRLNSSHPSRVEPLISTCSSHRYCRHWVLIQLPCSLDTGVRAPAMRPHRHRGKVSELTEVTAQKRCTAYVQRGVCTHGQCVLGGKTA